MGVWEDIKDLVRDLIYEITNPIWDYAYNLYTSAWNYASQISSDLWNETTLIWQRIGEIPVLTYDVVVGWITPLIEAAKVYALNLVNNVIDTFDPIVSALGNAISNLESWKEDYVDKKLTELSTWVTNASGWFSVQLETSKDKIVGFIIDRFEYILDQVFKEEDK